MGLISGFPIRGPPLVEVPNHTEKGFFRMRAIWPHDLTLFTWKSSIFQSVKMINSFDWWSCQAKQSNTCCWFGLRPSVFFSKGLKSRKYTFQHRYWNENLLILIISFVQTKLVQTWGEAMKGWSRMQCVNISTAMAVASCHPDMSSKQTSGLYSIICIRTQPVDHHRI